MPIRDWSRIEPDDFHDFHQCSVAEIRNALNGRLLPRESIGGDLPPAYVASVGLGDPLPSLPIFLSETRYIPAPLEVTYPRAWAMFPALLKVLP